MKEIMSNTRQLVLVGLLILAWPTLVARASTNAMWDRQEFLSQLGNGPEVDRLVHAVARKPDYYAASDEIRALGKTRTDQARAALLRIAYGEIGQQHVEEAAIYYAASLEDKSQARALLVASDLDVLESGFRELCGQPLDEALLARAATAITNDSLGRLWNIARLFQMDTNGVLAERKATLIVGCMKTSLTCTGAKGLQRESEFFFEDGLPRGESHLSIQASLLGRTKGVTVQMIRDALGSETGVVRDFAVLAMAYASTPSRHVPYDTIAQRKLALTIYATNDPAFFLGDIVVRKQLHEVLKTSLSLTARFAAMSFLSWRPQPEDIPAFEWVAANDSFKSKPVEPIYFRMAGANQSLRGKKDAEIYPLRFLAEQTLKQLDHQKNQH